MCHMCAAASSHKAFLETLPLWHQHVFMLKLWGDAQLREVKRRPPGESSGATLTSRGRTANSFSASPPLLRLPSPSTYSSHPLTDPSDRGPALAPLHPAATRRPSLWKGSGAGAFMSRRKLYNDQQAPHVDGEPLERLFRVAMGIAALFRELVLLARLTKKS